MDRPGYDADLVLWAEDQADALRRAAASASNLGIDWENVAEEIEALARSERSKLASDIGTVIEHLAKLQASPAIGPRIGWRETILRVRWRILVLLGVSPGMKSLVDTIVRDEHAPALKIASEILALMARHRASRSSRSGTPPIRCSATGGRPRLKSRFGKTPTAAGRTTSSSRGMRRSASAPTPSTAALVHGSAAGGVSL